MEPIAHLIKVSVPNYLAGLPIPDSIGGWFRLGGNFRHTLPHFTLTIVRRHITFRSSDITSRFKGLFNSFLIHLVLLLFFFFTPVRDWFALLPPTALLAGLGFMSYRAFCPHGRPAVCVCVSLARFL